MWRKNFRFTFNDRAQEKDEFSFNFFHLGFVRLRCILPNGCLSLWLSIRQGLLLGKPRCEVRKNNENRLIKNKGSFTIHFL